VLRAERSSTRPRALSVQVALCASLARILGAATKAFTCVGGDFNVAPSDLDVYDPNLFVGMTHVSEPEREAIRVLEGLRSRRPHETLASPTSRSIRGGTTATARFTAAGDFELTCSSSMKRSPSLRPPVTSTATRARRKALDHAPVIGEFSL